MLPDFRNFTLDDVVTCLNNGGLETTEDEVSFARDNDFFKYIGCHDGNALYLIAFEDQEVDEMMYVSLVFVTIGMGGKLVADYGGCPEFESSSVDEIEEYIEKRCN